MTNARTMGNVRTNTVRTSYNYRKKLNTGSGRTGRTVKMKDGRTASAGRTGRAVSADSVRNGGSRKRNARSGSRMSSQTVRKSSGADRTGTMRAAGKSRAGAAALTVGRTMRDVAMNELGMKYATEDQIVWYTTEDREYVHQFEDVPSE